MGKFKNALNTLANVAPLYPGYSSEHYEAVDSQLSESWGAISKTIAKIDNIRPLYPGYSSEHYEAVNSQLSASFQEYHESLLFLKDKIWNPFSSFLYQHFVKPGEEDLAGMYTMFEMGVVDPIKEKLKEIKRKCVFASEYSMNDLVNLEELGDLAIVSSNIKKRKGIERIVTTRKINIHKEKFRSN